MQNAIELYLSDVLIFIFKMSFCFKNLSMNHIAHEKKKTFPFMGFRGLLKSSCKCANE